jgi:putative Ca2+/H+ antiporter (TMEM165/GDT1 family)
MGDKSQVVPRAFATRFRKRDVTLGVAVAALAVHLGSVFLERAIDTVLPEQWVTAAAGLAFIAFWLWTLRGDTLDRRSFGASVAVGGRS